MKKALVIIFTICAAGSLFSQEIVNDYSDAAYPALGWDTLKSMITYPEIARRTGIEGISNVEVKLDSIGGVMNVVIAGNPVFNGVIEKAVRNVYWQPDIENYKVRPTSVYFDVQFQFKNSKIPKKRIFTIETEKP